MACLAVCLSLAVILALGCLPSRGEAMGLPQPPPDLNFTISVEGVVRCKSCRYAGYVRAMDASPLPSTYLYSCGYDPSLFDCSCMRSDYRWPNGRHGTSRSRHA